MTIFEPRRDQTNISHLCSIDKADPKLPQQDELEKTKKKKITLHRPIQSSKPTYHIISRYSFDNILFKLFNRTFEKY